jgi:methylenetetrahydrofolate dehydrogenase (NADP+)/methenyltetrahydrofolate cyclohydrolase
VLAIVLVGADAPSAVYLQQILRNCAKVGAEGRLVEIGAEVTPDALCGQIERLNEDPAVAGIIVQMPLPAHIPLRTVIDSIDPAKDIDGIHPRNAGLLSLGYDGFLPATAEASVEILKRSGIEIAGKRVVVVGRSNVVGKPAALLLIRPPFEDPLPAAPHPRRGDPDRGRGQARPHHRRDALAGGGGGGRGHQRRAGWAGR